VKNLFTGFIVLRIMKYTKRNLHKLIGLSVKDAREQIKKWFNMPCTVRGYNLIYPAIAVEGVILFVDDDKVQNEDAPVVLAGAGDPARLQ